MTDLRTGSGIAAAAFLMGDPARASMLAALLGGQALTAGELAAEAGITAQTASGHLAKLTAGGLLGVERQGRHRYFRLASPAVAEALEGLMVLTEASLVSGKPSRTCGPKDAAMRFARTCYDHMAGRLAVSLADALQREGYVRLEDGTGIVTDEGARFLRDFGLDLAAPSAGRRPLCRTCLDWSERRPHLGGRLGAALLARTVEFGWLARTPRSRTLMFTSAGERGFAATFRCEPVWQAAERADAGQANGMGTRRNDFQSSADAARMATPSSARCS